VGIAEIDLGLDSTPEHGHDEQAGGCDHARTKQQPPNAVAEGEADGDGREGEVPASGEAQENAHNADRNERSSDSPFDATRPVQQHRAGERHQGHEVERDRVRGVVDDDRRRLDHVVRVVE